MKEELIKLEIKGIALDKETGLPIVVLQSSDNKHILPLPIGPFEASAIIIEIEGVQPPRPLTHDLLSEFFRKHNFEIYKLVIYDIIQENIMARIYYRRGIKNFTMEVRPSDGIAMTIRENAPVYAYKKVLEDSREKEWYVRENTGAVEEIIFINSPRSETPIM